jgi:hypothetical protein
MRPPLSYGHAYAVERAADPLHRTGIDAKPGSDLAHAFSTSRCAQSLADGVFRLGSYGGPAQPFALALAPRKPGADSFLDHGALELGKHAHHLKHGLAGRCRGVEALLMQE